MRCGELGEEHRRWQVLSLKLHCARHAWETFALHAGQIIRLVADPLRHADSVLILRIYAHALRNEETDLSFAGLGDPKRPYTAPRNETELEEVGNYLKGMARGEGFASELRSRCASPAKLAREEESQPKEDQ